MNYLPLSLSAASLVALALGTLWLCTQMTSTLGAAKGGTAVRRMLFAYACVLLASYAHASLTYLPSDERAIGDHAMVTVFAVICIGIVLCDGVRSRDRLYFLLRTIVVSSTFVALVGILQYLFDFDLTPHLQPPGMHLSAYDPSVLDREGFNRASGTTAHPIEFGVLMAMALPLAIHMAFRARQTGRRFRLWWAYVGLIAMGLLFSVSRSAVVGMAAAGLILFAGWPARRRIWMIVSGIAFLVVIKFLSPGLLGTFLGLFRNAGTDQSVQWRTHDYVTAKQLIAHHLWLGRGVGTWYAPKHEVFDNQYLLTLVDSGVLGLAAFMGIVLAAIYASFRSRWICYRFADRIATASLDQDLTLSVAASVAAILPTYATFDFASFPTVTALAFLLFGVAGAFLRIVKAEAADEPVDPYAVV
jgi:O-antigen ligase